MITDPHYFENTQKSIISSGIRHTTRPHKDKDHHIQDKLLLVFKVSGVTKFIFEQFDIIVAQNKIKNLTQITDRRNKSNEQIIKDQLQLYKDAETKFSGNTEILALNPTEYTEKQLMSQIL